MIGGIRCQSSMAAMDMFKKIKKIFYITFALLFIYVIITVIHVHQWASTEQGYLPPKTAVILHAVNNNLVTLDMSPPKLFSKQGISTRVKKNESIPVSDGSTIPAIVYSPGGEGPFPMIMYYHGGAFLEGYGSIHTHDNVARSLSSRTGSVVISVGYRLAPNHIFPAAIEDSYDALLWAVENAAELQGDPKRMAVVGDSSGGNIATVVASMVRDRDGPKLTAQVLYYPLTTFQDDLSLLSRDVYDSGYFLLSRGVMRQAREGYTPEESMWISPYSSPLQSQDLSNLPPAFIITAEFDPLRDEGEAYAQRLADSDIVVEAVRFRGVMHGFISFYEVMNSGKRGLEESSMFLNRAFHDKLETEPYQLRVNDPSSNTNNVRDHLEAYAFAAYLIGKQLMNKIS